MNPAEAYLYIVYHMLSTSLSVLLNGVYIYRGKKVISRGCFTEMGFLTFSLCFVKNEFQLWTRCSLHSARARCQKKVAFWVKFKYKTTTAWKNSDICDWLEKNAIKIVICGANAMWSYLSFIIPKTVQVLTQTSDECKFFVCVLGH